jgi:Domain of unknown function (DUF4157)
MSYRSRVHRQRNISPEEKTKEPSFFSSQNDVRKSRGNRSFFQPKLSVNKPGDIHEQEADSIAHAVVNKSGVDGPLSQPGSGIQRLATSADDEKLGTNDARMKHDKDIQEKPMQPPEKEKPEGIQQKEQLPKEEEKDKTSGAIQTKLEAGASTAPEPVGAKIEHTAGHGQPLPSKILQEMNAAFGADFSDVRIHTDASAEEMNGALQAQAFTHGTDIYFNKGKYNPEDTDGKLLLAHELTHVIQQTGKKLTGKAPGQKKNNP